MLLYIKVVKMDNVLKRIEDYALEEIMGERLVYYAQEIIQDR